jgi:hypothetical protein
MSANPSHKRKPSQPRNSAGNDTINNSNPTIPNNKKAEESKSASRYQSIQQSMPRQLDVMEFSSARAVEISSLINILRANTAAPVNNSNPNYSLSAQAGGGRRTFQNLPRHMRRRAMSHNPYRLPLRFQAAARREMQLMNASQGVKSAKTPKQRARKVRRVRRIAKNILAAHANRQKANCWLETHIWHAKRMHMKNFWGYRLALRPTDKAFRATYKANMHLSTVFDASFIQPIQLTGEIGHIIKLLGRFSSEIAVKNKLTNAMYVNGTREGSLTMYLPDKFPYGLIAPVQFHFKPATNNNSTTNNNDGNNSNSDNINTTKNDRCLWLWCHAAVFDELLLLLHSLSSQYSITVESLRGQLSRFELRGARTQQILQLVLRSPVCNGGTNQPNNPGNVLWDCFMANNLRSSASLPQGAIISMDVQHPDTLMNKGKIKQPFTVEDEKKLTYTTQQQQRHLELQSKPSSGAADKSTSASSKHQLLNFLSNWPSNAAQSPLYSPQDRIALTLSTAWGKRKHEFHLRGQRKLAAARLRLENQSKDVEMAEIKGNEPEKEENKADRSRKRREKPRKSIKTPAGTKGGTPRTYSNDVSVCPSILLIQKSLEMTGNSNMESDYQRGVGSGYDIIVPAGFSQSFLRCLVYGGCRAIGLADRSHFLAENNQKSFPESIVDSYSALQWQYYWGQNYRDEWQRKPSKKRVNFSAIAVRQPFQIDWAWLFGSSDSDSSQAQQQFVARYNPVESKEKNALRYVVTEYVLPATLPAAQATAEANTQQIIQQHVLNYYVFTGYTKFTKMKQLISNDSANSSPCLLSVSVECLGRGKPENLAMISLPTHQDLAQIHALGAAWTGIDEPIHKISGKISPESDFPGPIRATIGYLSVGMFSYRAARGKGLGFIKFSVLKELVEQQNVQKSAEIQEFNSGKNNNFIYVLLRNASSVHYRAAILKIN